MKNYESEVRERWGNTDAYREHEQKTRNYTREKWAEANDGMMEIFAEFDCLHDEGIAYANVLLEAGVSVELNETRGTMHGFDIMQKAQTTKAALAARIAFMKKVFENGN